eukprot:TRINITY_DN9904_c1_g1_i2.p1 TRINITY_DN9904_c1_g1~~TRINITY_DN9904_c1_g1_i2.p1  ORF type:complete len:210 (-),score=24.29 TRINITY_DN9904_c1_g1_i2:220-849(-)
MYRMKNLILVSMLALSSLTFVTSQADAFLPANDTVILLDFTSGMPSEPLFYSENDGVMGGVSTGFIAWDSDQKAAVFYGETLTDNNGGFSQVVSQTWPGFRVDADGLKLVVKGDGRTYKVSVARQGEGYSYSHDFKTVPGEWIEVYLPYSDFIPSFRGFILSAYTPITGEQVARMSFYSSKFTMDGGVVDGFVAGPFELFIKSVEAYQV